MKSCNTSIKLERKTVEKNRRLRLKSLYFKLTSIIPSHHRSRRALSQQDKLDQAADYIKKMKDRVDELKRKRDLGKCNHGIGREVSNGLITGLRVPIVEVAEMDYTLKVVLISGCNKNIKISHVISVVEEEGAEVVSADLFFVVDRVFFVIHSQVKSFRVGCESARVKERLSKLVS